MPMLSSSSALRKVYIVDAKINEDTALELHSLLETRSHWGLEQCANVADADIIITKITMRKRLERHVSWMVAVSYSNDVLHTGSDQYTRCKRLLLLPNGFWTQ
jgi:hypothetical protein